VAPGPVRDEYAPPVRILMVASEAFPLAKTGGLADVTGALSSALVRRGHDVRLLMPAYRGVARAAEAKPMLELGDPLGVGETRLSQGRLLDDVPVWLVENPNLYDRPGSPYLDPSGHDWPDNHLRFALLGRVAALLSIAGAPLGWTPDVVHAHDWQAGLAPAYLHWWGGPRPGTVFTIHNLHFAGRFPPEARAAVALPPQAYSIHGVELYGSFSFLKAGLYYGDRLTTVSPRYAQEIQTPLGGEGLHGLLGARSPDLTGILNGIDEQQWNPAVDPHLARPYDARTLEHKAASKAALQAEVGLRVDPEAPLLGSVGRLTWQKGVDLMLSTLPLLLERGGQLVVLGSGEPALETAVRRAAEQHPGRVAYRHGYDEPLSHQIIAGSDMFAVPSRFEPCGLTQMYAMAYGTVPIVRRTGGLADTVHDAAQPGGEGFVFEAPSGRAFAGALSRALEAWSERPRWRAIARAGMQRDFGWDRAAVAYEGVYQQARRSAAPPAHPPGHAADPARALPLSTGG
jgi:starch synthase